jgi:hypothetical protein
MEARARVLHDLQARGASNAETVSWVEDVVADRQWWVDQWPEGASYVAGQVAQDVQDRLLDAGERWPECTVCAPTDEAHELRIEPELGAEPHWVCETRPQVVARLGEL